MLATNDHSIATASVFSNPHAFQKKCLTSRKKTTSRGRSQKHENFNHLAITYWWSKKDIGWESCALHIYNEFWTSFIDFWSWNSKFDHRENKIPLFSSWWGDFKAFGLVSHQIACIGTGTCPKGNDTLNKAEPDLELCGPESTDAKPPKRKMQTTHNYMA